MSNECRMTIEYCFTLFKLDIVCEVALILTAEGELRSDYGELEFFQSLHLDGKTESV